jgi:hypothetical protein
MFPILDPKILDPPFEVGVHLPYSSETAIIWSLLAKVPQVRSGLQPVD